jgi:hypothetical protein
MYCSQNIVYERDLPLQHHGVVTLIYQLMDQHHDQEDIL